MILNISCNKQLKTVTSMGGDGLKFGDVIMAVASGFVLFIVLDMVLNIPMDNEWEYSVVEFVSLLVAALIVGYVFAGKIREDSRMISIGKIVVMAGFVGMFFTMIGYAAVSPHYTAQVDQLLRNSTSTSSWTNADWLGVEVMVLWSNVGINVLEVLALSFVGLYLGSMRKPSAKTKE
jgi:chromate transport protein ChrA